MEVPHQTFTFFECYVQKVKLDLHQTKNQWRIHKKQDENIKAVHIVN